MAVRRLYEPLCIAFGTTVSSPTAPTYQLYDLPHKAKQTQDLQHKTTLGVPKPLRIYLQVANRKSYHYLEVNSKRLGGRCRMGLGAVNAAPCVHGRRSARGAVNKRPQAAARANHRRHSAPLRAPHRVGAIHYATRSAPAPRTQGAASSAGGTIYTPHHGAPKHMA